MQLRSDEWVSLLHAAISDQAYGYIGNTTVDPLELSHTQI
jgi:hypothetical protein